jgi:hypothetical protein
MLSTTIYLTDVGTMGSVDHKRNHRRHLRLMVVQLILDTFDDEVALNELLGHWYPSQVAYFRNVVYTSSK